MMLRYVGEDGKDGLKHGNVYDCLFCSDMKFNSFEDVGIFLTTKLPDMCSAQRYKSIKEMMENWQEV